MTTAKTINSPDSWRLPSQLDLRAALPLKENFAQLLRTNKTVTVDASGVTKMSTACAQVIAAYVISARKTGSQVTFSPVSPIFMQALSQLGLASILEGSIL